MSRIDGGNEFYEDTHTMQACIDRDREKVCFRPFQGWAVVRRIHSIIAFQY